MRWDKFLKVSRLIKRRTVANDVCDSARVFVNNNPAKPAKQLKVGDIISIEYKNATNALTLIESKINLTSNILRLIHQQY